MAATYYAILKNVPEHLLRAAVVSYLAKATEPWFPMPAVLLDLARKAKRREQERAIERAEDCERCQNTGLVSARPIGSERWLCLSCVCVRGITFASHARFDPQSMETWREHAISRMEGLPAPEQSVKAITDQTAELMTVPIQFNKPANQQVRELVEARKNKH